MPTPPQKGPRWRAIRGGVGAKVDAANHTHARVLSAGLDWLTATARPGFAGDGLARLGGELVAREREAGNRQREWRWRDYRGLIAGGAAVGNRMDGAIVRVSGPLADEWGASVAGLASNLSRCDLQVTWMDAAGDSDAAVMRLWRSRAALPERGRPAGRTIIRPELTGPTIYAGSRTSDQFGRIYDKHGEEPERWPAGAVRAEVELKGAVARAVQPRIAANLLDAGATVAYAEAWYRKRGVGLPIVATEAASLATAPPVRTDADRTLRWLETQVKPGVARSIRWVGLSATLQALGLGHLAGQLE